MAEAAKKKEKKVFLLPEGRLINESLFEKDAYTDAQGRAGTPMYKVEMAFDPASVTGEGTFEDNLADAAADAWGDAWFDRFFDGDVKSPFLSGDKLAQKRADKGKEGDAYKGKLVLRSSTIYNLNGQDAPGGIQVWDENVQPIGMANRSVIYPGMYGVLAVTIHPYLTNEGDKALKCYLEAFQRTRDGEKLVASKDSSKLFKPVGRDTGASEGRRSRRG